MTGTTATRTKVLNYIGGSWMESKSADWKEVINPATGETIALTPLSTALRSTPQWKRPPPLIAIGGARLRKTAFSRSSS